MAIENWIDELVKISEIELAGKRVRGFRLYEKAEFPGALAAGSIPCILTFVGPGVRMQYGYGPCFEVWRGSCEYHLTPNLDRAQLPTVYRAFRLIRDQFAAHRTLGNRVANCELVMDEGDSITGPVKLQYGSEEEHFGLIAHWRVKEHVESEITLGD